MAKNKFYAVRGNPPRLFHSWPECEAFVKGLKGAEFRGFANEEEAQIYLGLKKESQELEIYVDGSYISGIDNAGWAWVAIENGKEIASDYGKTPFVARSRNIDGETYAAMQAALWLNQNQKKATLCYDYEGLQKWALKIWKANAEVSMEYQNFMQPYLKWISFKKVSAHSGIWGNERADFLAKKSLEEIPNHVIDIKPLNPERPWNADEGKEQLSLF